MRSSRVIPVLLLSQSGLVKTTKFGAPVYIGDAINAVKIFNDKEADEILILDIEATKLGKEPNFGQIEEIASEAFMPLGYVLNSGIHANPDLLNEASKIFGSQSIVVSIDVKKDYFGRYRLYSNSGTRKEKIGIEEFLARVQSQGAGEVILNSIDRDGMMSGYDLSLVTLVAKQLAVPLVALGGAGNIAHLGEAVRAGASAVAAGSMFVFQGRHKAVLISYLKSSDFLLIPTL